MGGGGLLETPWRALENAPAGLPASKTMSCHRMLWSRLALALANSSQESKKEQASLLERPARQTCAHGPADHLCHASPHDVNSNHPG